MITVKLNHCLFHYNYWRIRDSNIQPFSTTTKNTIFTGGNALFKLEFNDKSTTGTLNILHSEFAHGRSTLGHVGGGGLEINIKPKDSAEYSELEAYNITVYNCSMYKNTASVGANMLISIYMPLYSSMTIHIDNCKFFEGNSTSKGAGFMLQIESTSYEDEFLRLLSYTKNVTVYLENSEFYGNSAANGSGLYLGVESVHIPNTYCNFIIQQCAFQGNTGEYGSGMYIFSDLSMDIFMMSIKDLIFVGNNASTAGSAMYIDLKWFRNHFPYNNFHSEATLCIIDLLNSTFIQNAGYFEGTTVYITAPVDPRLFPLYFLMLMKYLFSAASYYQIISSTSFVLIVLR